MWVRRLKPSTDSHQSHSMPQSSSSSAIPSFKQSRHRLVPRGRFLAVQIDVRLIACGKFVIHLSLLNFKVGKESDRFHSRSATAQPTKAQPPKPLRKPPSTLVDSHTFTHTSPSTRRLHVFALNKKNTLSFWKTRLLSPNRGKKVKGEEKRMGTSDGNARSPNSAG